MKAFLRLAMAFIAVAGLVSISCAGPESLPDSKEVAAVAPPACEWSGFYLGVNVGGQFGHSEDKDLGLNSLTAYNAPDRPWGYHESGVIAGGQAGYNWQFGHFVFGPEIDAGYMNLKGRGIEPGFPQDTFGESKSDLYASFRGRLGIAFNCWLLYATGGGIGVNYTTRVVDTSFTNNGPDTVDAHRERFDFGYTFGGGLERMLGRHWSVRAEYLYFNLDDQNFSAVSGNGYGPYHWRAETEGHMVRAGLNYHF